MSTAASAHAEGVVSEYDQAKPFNDIPGPAGLPYIGTMLLYRNGKQFLTQVQDFFHSNNVFFFNMKSNLDKI